MVHELSNELQIGKAGEHLVCSDLILQGFNAFLADQGLPYDVVVDNDNKLWKIQVRATLTLSSVGKSLRYRFQNSHRKFGRGRFFQDYSKFTCKSPQVL